MKLSGLLEIARAMETEYQQATKMEKLTVNAVDKRPARGRGQMVRPKFPPNQCQSPYDGQNIKC